MLYFNYPLFASTVGTINPHLKMKSKSIIYIVTSKRLQIEISPPYLDVVHGIYNFRNINKKVTLLLIIHGKGWSLSAKMCYVLCIPLYEACMACNKNSLNEFYTHTYVFVYCNAPLPWTISVNKCSMFVHYFLLIFGNYLIYKYIIYMYVIRKIAYHKFVHFIAYKWRRNHRLKIQVIIFTGTVMYETILCFFFKYTLILLICGQ